MITLFSPEENRHFTVTSEHYKVMINRGTAKHYQLVVLQSKEEPNEINETEVEQPETDGEAHTDSVTNAPKTKGKKA